MRSGTVCLLGAGASAGAGYPLAAELQNEFLSEVVEDDRAAFTILWELYLQCSLSERYLTVPAVHEGRPRLGAAVRKTPRGFSFSPYALPQESTEPFPPSLEAFFAFYDLLERPILRRFYSNNDLPSDQISPQVFRSLRQAGLRAIYRTLGVHLQKSVSYLDPLFSLPGPHGGAAIATLNFDVALESRAVARGVCIADGFAGVPDGIVPSPESFVQAESATLRRLWEVAHTNMLPYVGFLPNESKAVQLIKLHGSIGWFNIEEGSGDIGNRSDLRQNTVYAYLKLPLERIGEAERQASLCDLAVGGVHDICLADGKGTISRKAGQIWLRPNIVFARATKLYGDHLYLNLLSYTASLMAKCEYILIVGYSWNDFHINELILHGLANGAGLVNVSLQSPAKHTLGLLMQRFPTTFREIARRIFMFGGGCQEVLSGRLILPNGDEVSFDIVDCLANRRAIPVVYSLGKTFIM